MSASVRLLFLSLLLSPGLLLHACDQGEVAAAGRPEGGGGVASEAALQAGVMLVYREQEAGLEPYTTRIIVTPDHLRIDDGVASDDFVLLDRSRRVIYSVNSADGTVITIPWADRPLEPPIALETVREELTLGDAPGIAGHRPVHHRYTVNGETCVDVIAVPGLADDAALAMGEYREVLASEHRRLLPMVPADQHRACDLVRNVFDPGLASAVGVPLQQWDATGYRRSLTGFELDFQGPPGLFRLPAGYRQTTLGGG